MFERIRSLKNLIGSTFKSARTRTGAEFLLLENNFGTLHVEADVVRKIVERVKVNGVHEVKNVAVDAPSEFEPMKIQLNLVITPDYSAPKVGANLRDEIKRVLYDMFKIKDALFDIRVAQISQPLPEKKRRQLR